MLLATDTKGIVKRIAAVIPVLFLVPVVRKLRERRHEKPRRHFPIHSH